MNQYESTGYRFISRHYAERPQVGDVLDASFVWDGDEMTDEELAGTCCLETLPACKEYARYSTGWIVQVGGYDEGRGELPGEIIISDATVVQVTDWRNS